MEVPDENCSDRREAARTDGTEFNKPDRFLCHHFGWAGRLCPPSEYFLCWFESYAKVCCWPHIVNTRHTSLTAHNKGISQQARG
eukprot:g24788.t1